MTGYLLDQGDVLVEGHKPAECEECSAPATKDVFLDLRAIGETRCIGVFCDECAAEMAERLKRGLPPEAAR
jgi:hypothetical protein